ncbi:hypothetical protein QVD17_13268 [Tagetes erecta]|uniref:CCHC-type domain-containing protein n=1 Tax=Tagetes erecta TaxID=13708 RepID=A0AAD8L0H1_TARER|nr:hypothetical protein QVD17_13268 [Tagetes erecta]
MEESISISTACTNAVNSSSFSTVSETITIDANNKFHNTNEIITTQNDVTDEKGEQDIDELKETNVCLEIDHVEKFDNSILRKLLRGPRYFDPPENGSCYNCGESGHTITNCTAANRKKPCFLCGSLTHKSRKCKQRKKCYHCKKTGHFANDCPEKSTEGFEKAKICLKCGDSGHEMYTCKTMFYSVDDLKEIQCYICKQSGHLCCVDYGEGPSEVSCYRCGQLGHTGLKCTSVSSSASVHAEASPSYYCYKCGQEGHKSRKCKTLAKKRRRKNAKQSNLQDSTDHVGVKSAPQELGDTCKTNKTQNGHSTPSQPKRRGGWMDEDEDPGSCFSRTQQGSLSTPASYRSNNGFHGSSDYTGDFQYED